MDLRTGSGCEMDLSRQRLLDGRDAGRMSEMKAVADVEDWCAWAGNEVCCEMERWLADKDRGPGLQVYVQNRSQMGSKKGGKR